MPRVTEKTLRPRQYVFEGVARERRAIFRRRIREVREREERAREAAAREAAERAREAARAHAQAILRRRGAVAEEKGVAKQGEAATPVESPELAELHAELAQLTAERARLFALLNRTAQTSGQGRATQGGPHVQPGPATPVSARASQRPPPLPRSQPGPASPPPMPRGRTSQTAVPGSPIPAALHSKRDHIARNETAPSEESKKSKDLRQSPPRKQAQPTAPERREDGLTDGKASRTDVRSQKADQPGSNLQRHDIDMPRKVPSSESPKPAPPPLQPSTSMAVPSSVPSKPPSSAAGKNNKEHRYLFE